jgi:uncharacterized RDD family membrane protein YckC
VEIEDTYVTATPEGVSFSFVLAGLGSRASAYLIDFVVQWVFIVIVFFVLAQFASSVTSGYLVLGIFALLYFVVTFGYFVAFEMLDSGRSLGKRALGIRVTRVDGSGVKFGGSLVRNLMRLLYSIPLFYLLDGGLILGTKKNQRLGDLLAGTIVVRYRLGEMTAAPSPSWADSSAWATPTGPGFAMPGRLQSPAPLPPELESWDVTAVTQEDMVLASAFLARRFQYEPMARHNLGVNLAGQLWPKVAGPTTFMEPERFLEAVAMIKSARG